MPRRDDIHKILLIGSGPIIIGQACEFDYSGTQACKALREEGYEVVLVNSNPATIMTDPEMADRTYIEPLTWEIVAKVIEAERPDALLPTLGGQTGPEPGHGAGRGTACWRQFGVEMIGANAEVIAKAEERDQFKAAMERIGLEVCRGADGHRPGRGPPRGGRRSVCPAWCGPASPSAAPAPASPTTAPNSTPWSPTAWRPRPSTRSCWKNRCCGWKEFEMEVMRDADDNVVIICSIENFDPMGVHTGDSITVAPAQTLTDKEYQRMRDASIAVIREIGVETGGSNIQFAIDPQDGRMVVIEMNPRVSRSSALASKATGFPIAKIAAKLAVGYRLHELPNDITRETMACFEPTIDYVVTKVPRFAFEKFPEADAVLTTQMKSVGETMAIGRTFKESFQKALRGLEVGSFGFGCDGKDLWGTAEQPTPRGGAGEAGHRRRPAALVPPLRHEVRHVARGDLRADGHRPLVPGEPPRDRRAWKTACGAAGSLRGRRRRPAAPGQAVRLLRPPVGGPLRRHRDGRPRRPQAPRHRRHLQVGRHLRRRVRGLHALLLFDLRRRGRDAAEAAGAAAGHDPRRRAQPHRPGHRVRLLLLPRQLRPARAGHPVDHGQLQSRDRQHRLRHQRPAVLRAADDRGRAEHLRPHAAGRRDRAVRRADAAEPGPRRWPTPACRSSAPAWTPSRTPRTGRSSPTC